MSGGDDRPALPEGLHARLCAAGTLAAAWDRVRRRGAGPGIDRVSVEEYAGDVGARLEALSRGLADGTYRPRPGLRTRCAADPTRQLAVPSVEDRIVQRALADLLTPAYEPVLSDAAFAYRPGRSVAQALDRVQGWIGAGFRCYCRTDVARFFDSIDRERLEGMLRADGVYERVVCLIGRLHGAGTLEGAAVVLAETGIPQGSGLSPLLSNVYLRSVDLAMGEVGYPYLRYADDMLLLAATPDEVGDAHEALAEALARLGLTLSARKTRRGHVAQGFDFLGLRFDERGRRVSAAAYAALHRRCGEVVREAGGSVRAAARLVDEWESWHGPLRGAEVAGVALLAGCVARPAGGPRGAWLDAR